VLARDYTRRMTTYKGERNPFWKGGRSVASNGYVLIRVGVDHHLADCRGYAYEHRLVAEAKLNRRLVPKEAVHHINGIKDDNRPENIEVLPTRAHHMVLHRKRVSSRRNPGESDCLMSCKCGCGERFNRFDKWGRRREYVSGHNTAMRNTANAQH